ncbi:MAG: tetratricopeptide repeat protein [Candidatus Kaelpia imicola]|nr:tetratricopeptide repeat protein [Candidatus Kaelpia imicola]
MLNRDDILPLLIIVAAGLIVYIGILDAPFIYDDIHLVLNNELITSFKYIPELFKTIFNSDILRLPFRPLQIISYMFDYKLWTFDPRGYHLINVLLHVFNSLLLYGLSLRFFKRRKEAFLIALLFVIHPLNTGAVSYISGRADLLAGYFSFLSLILFFRFLDSHKNIALILSMLSFVAAILSKEIALIVPLLLLTYVVIFYRPSLRYLICHLVIAAIYMLLRLPGFLAATFFKPTLSGRFLTAPYLFFRYLKIIFFPHNLRLSYAISYIDSPKDPAFILYFILLSLVVCLGLYSIRKSKRMVFFSIWYILNFLLISGVVVALNAPCAEHWLYLGLPAIFALMVSLIYSLFYRGAVYRYAGYIFITGMLIYYGFSTLERNKEWGTPEDFYKNEIEHTPSNYKAHYNLGIIYFNEGRYLDAEEEFKKTITIFPELHLAYYGLALTAEERGDMDEAISCYCKSLDIAPEFDLGRERLKILKGSYLGDVKK